MKASGNRYTRICPTVVGLLVLALCLLLAGCSDMVLLPDGSIGHVGDEPVTGWTDPENNPQGGGPVDGENETEGGEKPSLVLPFGDATHKMYVEFFNTGKSDCVLIRVDDTVILLDTADADDYATISGKLTSHGIDTIDYLIISHFDNDHIGSADKIVENFTVKSVYMPDYVRRSARYNRVMTALEASPATEVHRLQNEDIHLTLPYGSLWINASALYERQQPFGSDEDNHLTADENDFSLITSLYFGEVSLLLPGDAERARMEEFNAVHGELPTNEQRYTLIKTPHHGGYDMGLAAFMDRARPRYAVVTTDAATSIDKDLSRKLAVLAARSYFSYGGDIVFATDGDDVQVFQ